MTYETLLSGEGGVFYGSSSNGVEEMKKKFIYVSVLILLIVTPMTVWAFENKPDGFRGIKWRTNIKNLSDMKFEGKAGATSYYHRQGDKMKIGSAMLDDIGYGFYKNEFYIVMIQFHSLINFDALKSTFFQQYGPGYQHNRYQEDYYWGLRDGSDVVISLEYNKVSKKGAIFFEYQPLSKAEKAERKRKAKAGKDDL
jgi:hypothetical protein